MSAPTPQEVAERALEACTADGCVVRVDETSEANLRWAGNTLTTNGLMRSRSLTVVATVGSAEGTAAGVVSTSHVDADQVVEVVRRAERAARESGPMEDAQPLVSDVPASPDFAEPAPETSTDVFAAFAEQLGESLRSARAEGRELFGFAEHDLTTTYLASSAGLRLRHVQPTGKVEITGKSHERTRSTWVGVGTRDFTDVDVAGLDAEIRRRLGWFERRIELDAGRYDTILPPGAMADLMIYAYWSAAARDADDGRTVFSRPGGGTRVGERLASRRLTMLSDPARPGIQCRPFVADMASSSASSVFDAGLPLGPTEWVRDGELRALLQTRHSAQQTGLPVTPAVDNLVLEDADGTGSVDDLVATTDRGLLLTCLWYIREVDPQTLLLTGLTRDGVHLVEHGEVVGTVTNFRFNESPIDLLGRVEAASASSRCLAREWSDYFTRTQMPAVRVGGFNMSSVSQAS
ncbi:MAG TPA: metallopeptidase TldD-related protein [Actinomycetes bacterium]|nr:metallopeptidase TldD-related protein [Actinomycetes bacterium]